MVTTHPDTAYEIFGYQDRRKSEDIEVHQVPRNDREDEMQVEKFVPTGEDC
jgi:hypothetical protein